MRVCCSSALWIGANQSASAMHGAFAIAYDGYVLL